MSLEVLPKPGIHIRVKNTAAFGQNLSESGVLTLRDRECHIEGFATDVRRSTSGGTDVDWCPSSEPVRAVGNKNTRISNIHFHLFNFKDILGTSRSSEKRKSGTHAIVHVKLDVEDWRIELRSLFESWNRFKKLKAKGGGGLTHIGSLAKSRGGAFSGKEANQMLQFLRFFLSFAQGNWCNPICPVGFDGSKKRVWEEWSSPQGSWRRPISWFDAHHCEQLVALIPGFLAKWKNEQWRTALVETIYWYLRSNDSARGIDAGIILTQAAIERLSYQYVVLDRKLIEAGGFRNLRASDKFRLLFSSLNIPIEIPGSSKKMIMLGKKLKWVDSPQALTEVRNSLIHPEKKHRRDMFELCSEAWELGLWYLELALLGICDYRGSYSNRLVLKCQGQVEPVPWHQDTPPTGVDG